MFVDGWSQNKDRQYIISKGNMRHMQTLGLFREVPLCKKIKKRRKKNAIKLDLNFIEAPDLTQPFGLSCYANSEKVRRGGWMWKHDIGLPTSTSWWSVGLILISTPIPPETFKNVERVNHVLVTFLLFIITFVRYTWLAQAFRPFCLQNCFDPLWQRSNMMFEALMRHFCCFCL